MFDKNCGNKKELLDEPTASKARHILASALAGLALLVLMLAGLMAWFLVPLFSEMDVSALPSYHPFKSEKAKNDYLSFYDSRAKKWPVVSETRLVDTSFGKTFTRISGRAGAPSLVLLPAANTSSLVWMSNIKALSASYRVYALDNIYDVGRSVYVRPPRKPEDFVKWLDETLTALGLQRNVNLMGYSYGG